MIAQHWNAVKTLTAAAIVAGSFLVPGQSWAEDVFTLRWASFVSPMALTNRETIPAFIKEVEAASEGTLKIDFFPGGTLGKSPVQQLSLVENGVADIAEVVVSYTPGRFAELGVFELPFLAETNTEAGLAAWTLYEKGLLSDFDDLMLVGVMISGPYGLAANKPLTSVADLKGLRLRAAGPTQSAIVSALGAVPVGNIPAPGIAENISRRLLDGSLMAPGLLTAFRISDAAAHHNWDLKLGSVAVILPMRRDTFEKMPEKAKAAFVKFSGEWLTRSLGQALDQEEAHVKKVLSEDNQQNIHSWSDAEVSSVREMLAPVKDKWDQSNGAGVNLYKETVEAIEAARATQ